MCNEDAATGVTVNLPNGAGALALPFFSRADANSNGFITRSEASRASKDFDRSLKPAKPTRPDTAPKTVFALIDSNKDGFLTRFEYAAAAASPIEPAASPVVSPDDPHCVPMDKNGVPLPADMLPIGLSAALWQEAFGDCGCAPEPADDDCCHPEFGFDAAAATWAFKQCTGTCTGTNTR